MMRDSEIDDLSGTWQAIPEDPALSVTDALHRRRRQRLAFALELSGCAIAVASALYFWLAGDGLVHRAAAVLFLLVAFVCGLIAARTRPGLSAWADWTAEGVLAFRLRECEVALVGAWSGLAACAVLVGFAAFVWIAAASGWDVLPPGFPQLYATLVGIVVLAGTGWSIWRIRTKGPECARLRWLLEEMRER